MVTMGNQDDGDSLCCFGVFWNLPEQEFVGRPFSYLHFVVSIEYLRNVLYISLELRLSLQHSLLQHFSILTCFLISDDT